MRAMRSWRRGGRNVRSYIQSGNVLFECSAREMASVLRAVKNRLTDTRAGEPDILCRSEQQLEETVRRAPFTSRDAGPTVKLYVAFLARSPRVKPRLPVSLPKEELEAVGMTDWEVFVSSAAARRTGFSVFRTTSSKTRSVCQRRHGTGRPSTGFWQWCEQTPSAQVDLSAIGLSVRPRRAGI